MEWVTKKRVELAKTGRWNTSTGIWDATPGQFRDAVRATKHPVFSGRKALIRPGHRDPRFSSKDHDGEPALGSVTVTEVSEDGHTLYGDVTYPKFMEGQIEHLYPQRSIESALGVTTADGEHFEMVVTGLAMLGLTPPAVSSLKDLEALVTASEAAPDWTAAVTIAASMDAEADVEAAAWNEALHPRQGGKFVSKGSGYSGPAKANQTGPKGQDGKGGKTDQGGTVKKLQEQLVRLGLLGKDSGANGGVDGKFGPKTEAAVMRWQKRAGMKPTGKVTPGLLSTLTAAKKSSDPKKLTAKRVAQRKAGKLPPKKPTAKKTVATKTAAVKKAVAARKAAPKKPTVKKAAPMRPTVKKAPKKPGLVAS